LHTELTNINLYIHASHSELMRLKLYFRKVFDRSSLSQDALSVCLNTIAVLFLYDVDTIAYKFFLDEQLRTRMERDGKVELDETNVKQTVADLAMDLCPFACINHTDSCGDVWTRRKRGLHDCCHYDLWALQSWSSVAPTRRCSQARQCHQKGLRLRK
jgi:hypothetical protein